MAARCPACDAKERPIGRSFFFTNALASMSAAGDLKRGARERAPGSNAGIVGSGMQGDIELIDGHDPVGIVEAFFTQ